jgi:hypothetical protein
VLGGILATKGQCGVLRGNARWCTSRTGRRT